MMDASDLIMSGGAPAFKFQNHGDTCEGAIVDAIVQQQKDFETGQLLQWPDGNPRMQVRVILATAERSDSTFDDGHRAVYVRGAMLAAVRDAVRAAGAARLEARGFLTITYTGDGEPTRKGFAPQKLFKAEYAPPTPAGVNVDEL